MRDPDAIAAFRRAIELKPDHAGAWSNLGLALQDAATSPARSPRSAAGLSLAPEFPQLHWNLALALLLHGDYAGRLARVRMAASHDRACRDAARPIPARAGPATIRAGRTLLVTAEQGLGDAIQHLRFVQRLAATRRARDRRRSCAPSQASRRPRPAFARPTRPDDPLPAYDAHVPLMSLPDVLGVTLDDVAAAVPYLRADAARVGSVAAPSRDRRARP